MEFLHAVLLGIIQGITEWLPVSSSGHLVLVQSYFLNVEQPVIFDLFLHLGSLIVVFFYFFDELKKIVLSFFLKEFQQYRKIAYYVIIGTIPTALIGYFLQDFFESAFSSPLSVAFALIITGLLLFFTEKHQGRKKINLKSALAIGLMQGIAITPGISRSGSTISAALFLGTDKDEAVRFSFLLFIPAMLGAAVLQLSKVQLVSIEWWPIILGTAASVLVGFLSLILLVKIVRQKKLKYFSYYCWAVGLLVILLNIKF